MFGENLADGRAEIRGEGEIAAFIQLVVFEAGPAAIDAATFDAAHGKHGIRVALARAAIPGPKIRVKVLLDGGAPVVVQCCT